MFSLLSQLLTVETAFSAILPSLTAHDALPVHGRSLLCPVYEGCLKAFPLIAVKGAELFAAFAISSERCLIVKTDQCCEWLQAEIASLSYGLATHGPRTASCTSEFRMAPMMGQVVQQKQRGYAHSKALPIPHGRESTTRPARVAKASGVLLTGSARHPYRLWGQPPA